MRRVAVIAAAATAVAAGGLALVAKMSLNRPAGAEAGVSNVKSDEVVLFYPTLAPAGPDGRSWTVPIHGCIFEPEADSAKRALLVRAIRRALGLRLDTQERLAFEKRMRLFLVDHERGKTIWVRVGTRVYEVGTSGPNGHFEGNLELSAAEVEELTRKGHVEDGWLSFEVVLDPSDVRQFSGRVLLPGRTGLSVISDIDDTIKITEVRDRQAMLANTFVRPFRPVPGMADLYRRLAAAKATFHYVSGSPWQLYEPLQEFCRTENFPRGTFHLKLFRLTDASALSLLGSQEQYKTETIEPILAALPERRFVFIGDSGEQDPEIYGAIARKHPEQTAAIFIRNVTGEPPEGERFRKAFADVPADRWRVFDKPADLEPVVSRLK